MSARLRMDKQNVTGTLVADPVVRPSARGEGSLTTMRMAVTPRNYNPINQSWENGQKAYVDVAVKNQRLGNNVAGSVTEGSRVTVYGNYEPVPFLKKDGTAEINHRIWADEVSVSLDYGTATITPDAQSISRAEKLREAEQTPEKFWAEQSALASQEQSVSPPSS